MSEPANPPAFPITPEVWASHPDFHGMTLRDWFAGQALAMLPKVSVAEVFSDTQARNLAGEIATLAGLIADAMLAERAPSVPAVAPAKPAGDLWSCEHGLDTFECETCRPF